tara:strand:- start:1372 stop:1872 length:501 start_codon:yes stop_codon:yes gene_type:complete
MIKKVIFLFIILCFNLSLVSQTKVAHIDTYELISNMPEMLKVQKQLEQYSKERMNEIRELRLAVRTKLELYKSEADKKTPEENKERLQEIEGMEENIDLYYNQIIQDMQKMQEDLMKPIYDDVFKVIQEVGKENGFDYVLDSAKNQGVLLANGFDLMEKVKIKLGF